MKQLKKHFVRLIAFCLILSLIPTGAFAANIQSGSRGTEVRYLQMNLNGLGYSVGNADGVAGKKTVAGIKQFQSANGLTADGIAGDKTKAKMTTIIKGLQSDLNSLGYSCGTVDGVFGSKATAAVKKFQSDNGISATGIANSVTLNKIKAAVAQKNTPKPTTPAPATNTQTKPATTTPTSPTTTTQTKPATTTPTKPVNTLTKAEIKNLQKNLNGLGYSVGTVDGIVGTKTTAAIKKFQTAHDLTVSGNADEPTRARMFAVIKKLQVDLNSLGYNCGTEDGIYGTKVTEAVKSFQRKNGIQPTGFADAATLNKIKEAFSKPADTETIKHLQVNLTGLGYYSLVTNGIVNTATTDAIKKFQKDYGLAVTGTADKQTVEKATAIIEELQLNLNRLGYNCGTVTGRFNADTKRAIQNFQNKNGITTDYGYANIATLNKIKADAKQMMAAYVIKTDYANTPSNVVTYSKKVDGERQLTKNFKVKEFACKNYDEIKIDLKLVALLQEIRDHFGGSVTITSGYRTPQYQEYLKKKGYHPSNKSQHLKGKAADIQVANAIPLEVARYAESLGIEGIGFYKNYVHVDTRPAKEHSYWKTDNWISVTSFEFEKPL